MKEQKTKKTTVILIAIFTVVLFLPGFVVAGDLEPSGPPGPTMKTLDEIPPTWSQILDSSNGDASGCNSSRFECVMGGAAVLDKETGLVWAKDANIFGGTKTWVQAMDYCRNLNIGNRKGWRLPTVEELASLVDVTQNMPTLPSGHPFVNVQSSYYWSRTTVEADSTYACRVDMYSGYVYSSDKTNNNYVWPVRGGN